MKHYPYQQVIMVCIQLGAHSIMIVPDIAVKQLPGDFVAASKNKQKGPSS